MSSNKRRKLPYSAAQTVHSFEEEALDQNNVESTAISDTVSADGRRRKRDTAPLYTAPANPPPPTTSAQFQPDLDGSDSQHASYVYQITADDVQGTRAQKRTKSRRNNFFLSTVCFSSSVS